MNDKQKDYVNKVILPKLIEMAIDGSLPSDMNELSYADFEKESSDYNISPDQVRSLKIERLSQYVSDHEFSFDDQLNTVETYNGDKSENLINVDGITPFDGSEYMTINDLHMSL